MGVIKDFFRKYDFAPLGLRVFGERQHHRALPYAIDYKAFSLILTTVLHHYPLLLLQKFAVISTERRNLRRSEDGGITNTAER